ncbi:MAG: type III-A CRISPR-associated RAMP protein Csm4 [Faecalibacterium sp.]
MNYYLFKLQFDTAVHFGGADSALSLYTSEETLRADTLFSALCHEMLLRRGESGLEQLCEEVRQGRLLFSDTMPWYKETFYLPKPIVASESAEEVPTEQRKKVKKLAWIPVMQFDAYAKSLHEGHFVPEKEPERFGTHFEQTKAQIPAQGDSNPYQVGLFRFAPDCGLYFLCGCAGESQAHQISDLLKGLGLTGIGGRTTTGSGKFQVVDEILLDEPFDDQTKWLYRALSADRAPYLLLTTSLPQENELETALEGGSFQVVRRGGFMASEKVDTPIKKKTQYYLAAGSVLQHPYRGALYNVGMTEVHPVYRYAKPIFMGVNL